MPILWHIMKMYSSHGINEFVICCGYKGYVIKEYFANYGLHQSDVTFDLKNGTSIAHTRRAEPWKVTLVDTRKLNDRADYLKFKTTLDEKPFVLHMVMVCQMWIYQVCEFHKEHGKEATLTATYPPEDLAH